MGAEVEEGGQVAEVRGVDAAGDAELRENLLPGELIRHPHI